MIPVEIPIKDPKKPPKLIFPDRCVHCGKPKAKSLPARLNTGARTKSGQMIQLEMDVPLCADCVTKENKIGNVTWIPFFGIGLLTCVIVFIPVWLFFPEGTTTQTYALPYVLGAFVGMIAGILNWHFGRNRIEDDIGSILWKITYKTPTDTFLHLHGLRGFNWSFHSIRKSEEVIEIDV